MDEGVVSLSVQTPFDGLTLRLLSFNPHYRESPDERNHYRHSHQAFELHLVKKGRFTLMAGEDAHPMPAGRFALLGPGQFHSSRGRSDDFDEMTLSFEVLMKGGAPGPDGLLVLRALAGLEVITGAGEDVTLPCAALAGELSALRPGYLTGVRAALQQLVLALARRRPPQGPTPAAPPPEGDLNLQRSFIIDTFFASHFALGGGDTVLAGQLGVSRRQLDRILKALYGVSYRQKLQQTRLEVARELLAETSYSMAEIAERLGYSNAGSFHAFVRGATGKTPGAIRREGQKV